MLAPMSERRSHKTGERVRVYVTFDVDPDGGSTQHDRTAVTWKGVELVPEIRQALSNEGIKFTFFLRCDNQIRDLFGTYLGLYHEYRELWDRLVFEGHEFGWHPHLYERVGDQYVPLRRPEECCVQLREAWKEVRTLEFPVTTVRIGEAWHSTETMRELDALGLCVDSTAVPGRRREDSLRSFDWVATPNHPYHPAPGDYRVSGGEDGLSILEVPMTTSFVKTSYDREPMRRYLNPTFHRHIFRAALDGYLQALGAAEDAHLVLIFHPDELLAREPNGLYSYDWNCFLDNLRLLVDSLATGRRQFEFCRLRDALA